MAKKQRGTVHPPLTGRRTLPGQPKPPRPRTMNDLTPAQRIAIVQAQEPAE